MALILSIETATSVCSVAIHKDRDLLTVEEVNELNVHGKIIMALVDKVISKSKCRKNQLDAIAVSSGPGSYTGLRIGVSVAKGLAFSLQIPLISVDTLQALAYSAYIKKELVCDFIVPMLDARRMEIYTAIYGSEMELISPPHPLVVGEKSFNEYLEKGKVLFLGEAVNKVRPSLRHENAIFIEQNNSATHMGVLANESFQKNEFVDVAYFEPNYLKQFQVLVSKKNLLLS